MTNVEQFNKNSSRTADGLLLARFVLIENRLVLSPAAHHVLLALLAISHDAKSAADVAWLVSRTGHGPGAIDAALDELAREAFLERLDGKTVAFAALSKLALAWNDEILRDPGADEVQDIDPGAEKSLDAYEGGSLEDLNEPAGKPKGS